MTEKPPYGAPCNNCGGCCRDALCPLAQVLFGSRSGPCPALTDAGCGVVIDPVRYAPVQCAINTAKTMSEGAALRIGAGVGCDAVAPGEFHDPAIGARLRRAFSISRLKIRAAMLMWGVG